MYGDGSDGWEALQPATELESWRFPPRRLKRETTDCAALSPSTASPREKMQLVEPMQKELETKPKRPKSFITPPADKLGIGAIILMRDAASKEWQPATVQKYDPARGQHYLQFEDNSEEWISLLKLTIDKDWRLQVHARMR